MLHKQVCRRFIQEFTDLNVNDNIKDYEMLPVFIETSSLEKANPNFTYVHDFFQSFNNNEYFEHLSRDNVRHK